MNELDLQKAQEEVDKHLAGLPSALDIPTEKDDPWGVPEYPFQSNPTMGAQLRQSYLRRESGPSAVDYDWHNELSASAKRKGADYMASKNLLYVANKYGVAPTRAIPLLAKEKARLTGDANASDKAFSEALSKQFEQEDALAEYRKGAIATANFMAADGKTLPIIQTSLPGVQPWMKAEDVRDIQDQARAVNAIALRRMSENPELRQLWKDAVPFLNERYGVKDGADEAEAKRANITVTRDTGGNVPEGMDMDTLLERMAGLEEKDRNLLKLALYGYAASLPDQGKGFWQQLGESTYRGGEDIAQGYGQLADAIDTGWILDAKNSLSAGKPVYLNFDSEAQREAFVRRGGFTNRKNVRNLLTKGELQTQDNAFMLSMPEMSARVAFVEVANAPGKVSMQLTPGEEKALGREVDASLSVMQSRRELKEFGRMMLDPVEGTNWMTKYVVYPAAQSLGYTLMASTTAGMVALIPSAIGQQYDQNLAKGMAHDEAMTNAIPSGIISSMIERAQVPGFFTRGALGKTCTDMLERATNGFTQSWRGKAATAAAKYLSGKGIGQGIKQFIQTGTVEWAQEMVQNATPDIIQSVIAAGSDTVDSPDWVQAWKDLAPTSLETFAALLPYVVLGVGTRTAVDAREAHKLLNDVNGMELAGIELETAKSVAAEPDAEKKIALFREAFGGRSKAVAKAAEAKYEQFQKEQAAILDEGVQAMLGGGEDAAQYEAATQVWHDPAQDASAAELEGGSRYLRIGADEFTRGENGKWASRRGGEEFTFAQGGEALDAAWEDVRRGSMARKALDDLSAQYEAAYGEKLDLNIDLSKKRGLADDINEGILSKGIALERMNTASKDAASGVDKVMTPKDVRVIGRNVMDATGKHTVDLYNGANPSHLVREMAQVHFKSKDADGKFSTQVKAWKRQYEDATGNIEYASDTDGLIEWFSNRAVDYALTSKEAEKTMPKSFREFFDALKEYFKALLQRAALFSKMMAEGKVDQAFEAELKAVSEADTSTQGRVSDGKETAQGPHYTLEAVDSKFGTGYYHGRTRMGNMPIMQFKYGKPTHSYFREGNGNELFRANDSDLREITTEMVKFAAEYYGISEAEARKELQPDDIIDSARAWDDGQFLSELWQNQEDDFLENGGAFRLPDGAVAFPGSKAVEYLGRMEGGKFIPSQEYESKTINWNPDIRYTLAGEGESAVARASRVAKHEMLLADESHKAWVGEMRDRYNAMGRPDADIFLALMQGEVGPDEHARLKKSMAAVQSSYEGLTGEALNEALDKFAQREIERESAEAIMKAQGKDPRHWTPITDMRQRLDAFLQGAEAARKDAEALGRKNVRQEREKAAEAITRQKERARQMDELKRDVAAYAKKTVKGGDIRKSELNAILTEVTNARTGEDLAGAVNRIDKIAYAQAERYMMRKLNKLFERTEGKKVNGVLKGRGIGADAHETAEAIRETMNLTQDAADVEKADAVRALDEVEDAISRETDPKKREALMDEMDNIVRKIQILDAFGGNGKFDERTLPLALQFMQALVEGGRSEWKLAEEARKAFDAKVSDSARMTIAGGDGKVIHSQEGLNAAGLNKKFDTWLRKATDFVTVNQYGMEALFDWISGNDKTSGQYGSFLNRHFMAMIHESVNVESALREKWYDMDKEARKRIFGVGDRELNRLMRKAARKVEKTGIIITQDGNPVELVDISPNMAYKRVLEWEDRTLRPRLESQGYTQGSIDKLAAFAGEKLMEYGRWQVKVLYPEIHRMVNMVYRKRFGINLPRNEFYTPIRAYRPGTVDEIDVTLDTPRSVHATELNGSLKSRTENNYHILNTDGTSMLGQHIAQMAHFTAWTQTVRHLRATLLSPDVLKAVEQNYGPRTAKILINAVEDLARGGIDKAKSNAIVDALRSGIAKGMLGLNPVIMIKQLTSIPAYAADIGWASFAKGESDFWTHPKEAMETLRKSPYFRTRYAEGFERDVKFAMARARKGKPGAVSTLTDKLMAPIQWGDKGAVYLGGWAVYKHYHDAAIAEGKSEAEANKIGLREFEMSTKRSQQSGNLEDLSALQRSGSILQLATMYMTAPNAYYRMEVLAIRNLLKGRGSKTDALRRIFTMHLVMPVLFAWASSGLTGPFYDDDDKNEEWWKRMALASISGSLAGALLIGEGVESVAKWALGMEWGSEISIPLFDSLNKVGRAGNKARKTLFEDGISWAFIGETIDTLGKASQFAGVPYETGKRYAQAAADISNDETEFPIRRAAGFSKWALQDK